MYFPLNISDKPHFSSRMPVETLGEFGRDLSLKCDVDGEPVPDVKWFRDGIPLEETPNLRFNVMDNNHSLHINYMRLEDSGMFQCAASNQAGDVTGYTWLRVKSKLTCQDKKHCLVSSS